MKKLLCILLFFCLAGCSAIDETDKTDINVSKIESETVITSESSASEEGFFYSYGELAGYLSVNPELCEFFTDEKRNVVSVTDNGDGTITAVIESHVYYMDDKDNMILSEKPEIRRTMVLRPGYFRCVVENLKVENIGD